MSLTIRELNQLKKIVEISTLLIEKAEQSIAEKQAERLKKLPISVCAAAARNWLNFVKC